MADVIPLWKPGDLIEIKSDRSHVIFCVIRFVSVPPLYIQKELYECYYIQDVNEVYSQYGFLGHCYRHDQNKEKIIARLP